MLSINDYTEVIAERIPDDELEADERDFVKVVHFQNDPSRMHGIPFKFLLKEVCIGCVISACGGGERADHLQGEPFSETKKRLEKRTGIKGKAFEKIKFATWKKYEKKTYYLQDGKTLPIAVSVNTMLMSGTDDVLFEQGGAVEDDLVLGLDHVDKSRNRGNGQEMFLK